MIFNPHQGAKYILDLVKGLNQSSGNPTGATRDYYAISAKARLNNKHTIAGYFKKDAWGPYDFHRQFNAVYPEQFMFDYSIRLGNSGVVGSIEEEDRATQVGIRTLYRGYDEVESLDFDAELIGDYQWSTLLYFTYQF